MEPVGEEVEDSCHDEETLVPLPVVEVVRLVDDPFLKGVPFLGTSSFTLSPSINLYTNNFNLSGLDWVEGLKNLTVTTQPKEDSLPISVAFLEEFPQISVPE